MGFSYTFNWPSDPPAEEVYVTGSFDNWSKSAPLAQNVDGSWSVSIPLPSEKIIYKFVVDNNWVIDANAKTETDSSGITNNVLDLDDIAAASTVSNLPGGYIPESGGIPIAAASSSRQPEEASEPAVTESAAHATTASDSTATGATESPADTAAVEAETGPVEKIASEPTENITAVEPASERATNGVEHKEELAPTPTVMPQSSTLHAPFLGTPGIAIPANASDIQEFREVSTVDPRTLNEPKPAIMESESTVTDSAQKIIPEIPVEPEPTPIDTGVLEPAPSQGKINGLSSPSGEVSLEPNDELPKPSIKSNEQEPITQEDAIGASHAPPGPAIPDDAVDINVLQQPKLTTAEDEPVIINYTQTQSPPSADTTVSEVVDTSTSTAPEIVNAEDIPKDVAEPKPTSDKNSKEHTKAPKSKASFFDKWLGPNTVKVQHYPVILVAVCVTLYGVRYYFNHGGSMFQGNNADEAFAVFREL
ncbi:uncharacterized protein V1513DRAFT_445869 [Lipomyces chichibuensis]|uniref:uncharacterized protein n=1 Tax=Lipomyces chichibuensis TaxID=1546026 RepID=UPI003343A505